MKRLFICLFILLFVFSGIAQIDSDRKIDALNFDSKVMEDVMISRINIARDSASKTKLEFNDILKKTGFEKVKTMVAYDLFEESDPSERSVLVGGTINVSEIIGRVIIKTGTEFCTYKEAADFAVNYILTVKKKNEILLNPSFNLVGVTVGIDNSQKKLYFSIVLGNKTSIAPVMDASWMKYIGEKTYGLYYAYKPACVRCEKFDDISGLVDEIVVEEGKIFFVYSDFKKLSKLFKDPYDGLAVDIVQKGQFPVGSFNKINYLMPFMGLMQKPIYWPDLQKENEIKDPKLNKIKVQIGSLPVDLENEYEINLIVILDKYACRNVNRTYIESPKEATFSYELNLYKDPKVPNSKAINSTQITPEYQKQMCYRASNQYNKTKQNIFNCAFCMLRLPKKFTETDVAQVANALDKLKDDSFYNKDSLRLMEVELALRMIDEVKTDQIIADAFSRLEKINMENLDLEVVYTLFYKFIKYNKLKNALDLFSMYYSNKDIDIDILFSYITLACSNQEYLLSNDLFDAMKIAETKNHERFCQLISKEKMSFQVFENERFKEFYCAKCLNK